MELLLAGLAGCIGIDITMILNNFLHTVEHLEIDAEGSRREAAPKGFNAIELTVSRWDDPRLPRVERHRVGKQKSTALCPIH